LTGVSSTGGPGFVSGDPGELRRAETLTGPVRAQVSGLAAGVAARGRQGVAAAGSAEVGAAVSGLAGALVQAIGDTGLVLGQLGEVAGLSSANLDQAGGAP
jgi:hypothetical protein